MTAPDPHPSAPSRPPPPPSFSLSQSSCRLCRALATASAGEKEGKDPFSRLTHSSAWEERDFGHSPVHTSRCYPGWKVGRGEPPARCEQRQDTPCTYRPFGDVIVGRGQQQLSAGRCGAVAVASSSAFVSPAGLGRLGQGQGSSGLRLQGAAESCGSRERPMAGAGLGRSGLQGRGAGVAPFGGFGLREKGKKAREERRFAGGVGSSRRRRRAGRDGRDGDPSPLLRSTSTHGPRKVSILFHFRVWSDTPPPDRYFILEPTSLLFLPSLPPRPFAPAATPGSRTPFPSVTLSDPDGVAIGPCPVASIVPVLCIITSPKKEKKYKGHIFFSIL